MTASEFAFLALGLVLGIAGGAALIEVLRARPPVARQVRLTVAPNAIQPRLSSTLADSLPPGEADGPARGGPGDRRLAEPPDAAPVARTARRRLDDGPAARGSGPVPSRTPVLAADPGRPVPIATAAGAGTPTTVNPAQGAAGHPEPLWLRPTAGQTGDLVAVPMSLEPDPLTSALRATAAGSAVAAMAGGGTTAAASATARAEAGGATALTDPPATDPRTTDSPAGSAPPSATGSAPAAGACAEERRVAEERCALAVRARAMAEQAADALRRAQRTYDDHVARAETAAATADPRSVRAAKERAQQRFRDARLHARTRDDVEAAARAWLAEINQTNHDTREAVLGIERDRAAAAALAPVLERLAVEADAARISAERADEACVAARDAVAACDEAHALEVAAARVAGLPLPDAPDAPGGASPEVGAEVAATARIAPATPEPEDEFEFSTAMGSRVGNDPVIIRILRGDHAAMDRAVARLAGNDPAARQRWEGLLGSLAEALIDRSIEASAFDFPTEHPFWGPFSQAQCRDITAGLSSLGFHFDGLGGWVDDRLPGQRDLSLAVGYAGLDPMRIRHWPTADETRNLLREVQVAAGEYIAGVAGGLTLGELLTLLGRRADALTELWNEWGTVRPVLLDAA